MKLLLLDTDGEGMGMDLAMRALEHNHEVRYFLPAETNGEVPQFGKGMVDRILNWEASMEWADLIVPTGNSSYRTQLAPYFGRGLPIFGCNDKGAELELDRGKGQEVLKRYGVKTIPYVVVDSIKAAIAHIVAEDKPYCIKPWGGADDKALTCVPRTVDEAVFTLSQWPSFNGQLMLQERVEGIEMGIAGWFGPGGWSSAIEESFEHKKFLAGNLGENTGEMGTVIRHVRSSKLFDLLLDPLTDYLHSINYVGDCSINCIIDSKGKAWPLEFTCRLGWPDFCIRQAVTQGDPLQWMLDLIEGSDTLSVTSEIAVGVLLAHGDFPRMDDPLPRWSGYPIEGILPDTHRHLHFQQMMMGKAPKVVDGKVRQVEQDLTAGTYVMVVSGTGRTVSAAASRMYTVAEQIKWPGNLMYRNDIGKRLEDELPVLKKLGFAENMRYV